MHIRFTGSSSSSIYNPKTCSKDIKSQPAENTAYYPGPWGDLSSQNDKLHFSGSGSQKGVTSFEESTEQLKRLYADASQSPSKSAIQRFDLVINFLKDMGKVCNEKILSGSMLETAPWSEKKQHVDFTLLHVKLKKAEKVYGTKSIQYRDATNALKDYEKSKGPGVNLLTQVSAKVQEEEFPYLLDPDSARILKIHKEICVLIAKANKENKTKATRQMIKTYTKIVALQNRIQAICEERLRTAVDPIMKDAWDNDSEASSLNLKQFNSRLSLFNAEMKRELAEKKYGTQSKAYREANEAYELAKRSDLLIQKQDRWFFDSDSDTSSVKG